MGIMGSESELSVRALLGRRIIRVLCCGGPMIKKDAYSHLPGSVTSDKTVKPYPYSEVYLLCSWCEREIRMDLALDQTKSYEIWTHIEDEMFSDNKQRRAKPTSVYNRKRIRADADS